MKKKEGTNSEYSGPQPPTLSIFWTSKNKQENISEKTYY